MILHVDMDAFYASVEERDRPEIRGRPVIVGGSPEGRGVVAAANYEVRRYGVHSAMATAAALRLCPAAIVLPVRMSHYAAISRQIREVFFRYTPLVEPLSLDEAFLDVSGSEALFGPAAGIGMRIKREIREATGLVASVGVAPSKFLAKLASDVDKPDGFVVVDRDPAKVQAFLDPLPVGHLWGVGKVTGAALGRLNIKTVGELRRLPVELLRQQFGSQGEHFLELAQGRDDRRVVPDREAKSISHENTFATDIREVELLRGWLLELTEQVARRLRRHELLGRTVNLKVRFADFRTITRARSLGRPTHVTQEIWEAAAAMLSDALPAREEGFAGVRLLGVGVSGLGGDALDHQTLFENPGEAKQRQLDTAADAVRDKFGAEALTRASGLLRPRRGRRSDNAATPRDEM